MKMDKNQLILIVEDSDDDYEATVRAFQKVGNLSNPIIRCEDGQEALDYCALDWTAARPRPGIILLDLNLPGIDGRVVLKELKSNPRVKDIPIIVLTTSDDNKDIASCYELGANTYMQKPVKLEAFFQSIQKLKEYWFEIAILPRGNS